MTQTSPKPAPQNTTKLITPPHQALQDVEAIKPLERSGVHRQGIRRTRRRGLSLRVKATALAIALGTLPVFGIGAIAYYFANKSIFKQIKQEKQEIAAELADKTNRFMFERYKDIQWVAALPIFTNSNLRTVTSLQSKQEVLTRYIEASKIYDSIAVIDLNGNVIVQSQGDPLPNLRDRTYFKEVLKTDKPFISNPNISKSSGEFVVQFAAPIKDAVTGKTIAVLRSRLPVKFIDDLVKKFDTEGDDYHFFDASKKIFLAIKKERIGGDVREEFPNYAHLQGGEKVASQVIANHKNIKELETYAGLEKLEGLPELNWGVLLTTNTAIAFAPQRQLLLILLFGTVVSALVVGAIAAYLANRATRPILAATMAVEKLGQGELNTRISTKGEDELAILGANINGMAEQIQTLLVEQEEATRQQLAAQAEVARQQTESAEQQRLAKEKLQRRALKLLMEVDPVSSGDLTIRASVTEDEIGTVADSYNATIGSLRKIVTQVQTAALLVTTTTSSSEVSVLDLSQEALRQAQEIAAALDRIQEMSDSIRAVAANAEQAEAAVQQANQTVKAGDAAMNRTVEGILAIRETVSETSTKVKQLGESSQKISKVVNLIGRFAAQTNLLALKASIEAARAGEEGRGFAVLAEEVRDLAGQSAQATAEIESLVAAIQTETNELVTAMEAGTEQVAEGTKLVDETRQSLNKIADASTQISALVSAISRAAVVQSQVSESVTETMSDVAAIASKTSNEATLVSASFKELLGVAQELQTSVGQFKVS